MFSKKPKPQRPAKTSPVRINGVNISKIWLCRNPHSPLARQYRQVLVRQGKLPGWLEPTI